MNQQLINEREVESYIGISINTLRKWRWEGKGPQFVKLGRRVMYRIQDVEAFIAAGSRSSTSDNGGCHV